MIQGSVLKITYQEGMGGGRGKGEGDGKGGGRKREWESVGARLNTLVTVIKTACMPAQTDQSQHQG